MTDALKPGAEIEIAYPFVRESVSLFDGDGYSETLSWRPGTRGELVAPDDSEMVADGIGAQIMTIISIHKPGRFPERVFFTRRWRDPSGKEFGKSKLCMTTSGAFRLRAKGFRHEYRMSDPVALTSADRTTP
jgi:hypothetical protein